MNFLLLFPLYKNNPNTLMNEHRIDFPFPFFTLTFKTWPKCDCLESPRGAFGIKLIIMEIKTHSFKDFDFFLLHCMLIHLHFNFYSISYS